MIGLFNDAQSDAFSDFLSKAYLVGTHLNCLNKSIKACCWYSFELPQLVEAIQMSTNNIRFYKEADKNTGLLSEDYEMLDYALIGVCAVIKSNTVLWF